jgi:hypothetical protein
LPSFIVLWVTHRGLLMLKPLIHPYTFVGF